MSERTLTACPEQSRQAAWDRLQERLLAIKPGQTITVDGLVAETDLSPEAVKTVLDGLTRAELFEKNQDVFVRRGRLGLIASTTPPAARKASPRMRTA